jgi:hypothetical protein
LDLTKLEFHWLSSWLDGQLSFGVFLVVLTWLVLFVDEIVRVQLDLVLRQSHLGYSRRFWGWNCLSHVFSAKAAVQLLFKLLQLI